MSARVCKIGVMLVSASLLLTSCSLVKNRRRFGPNKDAQPAVKMEIQDLRRENTALREDNKLAMERMEALAKQMEDERAEQRRFRDMMATNFELLEQSVSLSMAKSSANKPVVQAENPNPRLLPRTRGVSTAAESVRPARAPRSLPPAASPSPSGGDRKIGAVAPADQSAGHAATAATGVFSRMAGVDTTGTGALDVRTVALATGGGAMATGNRTETLDDPDLVPPSNPRGLKGHGAAKSLYEKGFRHFARKDFRQTILVYQDFLERFPEDVYSDNAQFWIGEAYFRQNRLGEAESAYRQVLRNYEHRSTLEGYKTPDAIYRIGQTYLKRNDSRRARYYFSAAAERFPATSAGRKAQHELATLVLKTAGGAGRDASPGS